MIAQSLRVERQVQLTDFPSGSAMEFFDDHIYLAGDDARNILVLDTQYQPKFKLMMFEGEGKRIAKIDKADIEASAVIRYKEQPTLLLLGSASKPLREKVYLFDLPLVPGSGFEIIETPVFTQRLNTLGVPEINIEGCALVRNLLVMSNRGNKTHPDNLLFVTSAHFFVEQDVAPLKVIRFNLPDKDVPAGLSSLCYDKGGDRLFFTASVELTDNAYDDGSIGDSYIGYIDDISAKLETSELYPDEYINLSLVDPVFPGHKIESICIGHTSGDEVIAHMISDNDDGETTLFKISFSTQ